tara:strand:+ start:174 stop:323 length:150 start_codon:yes stop_codon:yes gene_type:complete
LNQFPDKNYQIKRTFERLMLLILLSGNSRINLNANGGASFSDMKILLLD